MVVASLVIALVTLILALFIHSETRDIFSRVNLMVHTLPGARDVNRCIRDIENSKEERATIVCDAPKNTHLEFVQPAPKISRPRRIKNGFWRFLRKVAGCWSGDVFHESMVRESGLGKWQIRCVGIGSSALGTLLKGGWEPFGVTRANEVWLRKHSNIDD